MYSLVTAPRVEEVCPGIWMRIYIQVETNVILCALCAQELLCIC